MSEKLSTNYESSDSVSEYDAVAQNLCDQFPPDSFERKLAAHVATEFKSSIINSRQTSQKMFPNLPQKSFTEELEAAFNKEVNCGGHSFEVDLCIFKGNAPIEKAAQDIAKQIPFVRQLSSEEQPREDEYKVFYRSETAGPGHHFIKERDGHLTEKNSSGPIRDFIEWPDSLKDAPEVTFAVKKDHDMFLYDGDGNQIHSLMIGAGHN